jgi:glutathione S-transferase
VPFFIKPITNGVASKIEAGFLSRSMKGHYDFVEEQLKTSRGDFLCGADLTGADIMLSCKSTGFFRPTCSDTSPVPLEAGKSRSGFTESQYPLIWAYVDRIHQREAYKRAVAKIVAIEGDFKTSL